MAKKPEPPKPIIRSVYKIASKAVWLGNVEAPDETTAMEKAAAPRAIAAGLRPPNVWESAEVLLS
jgi:hypothetical protein